MHKEGGEGGVEKVLVASRTSSTSWCAAHLIYRGPQWCQQLYICPNGSLLSPGQALWYGPEDCFCLKGIWKGRHHLPIIGKWVWSSFKLWSSPLLYLGSITWYKGESRKLFHWIASIMEEERGVFVWKAKAAPSTDPSLPCRQNSPNSCDTHPSINKRDKPVDNKNWLKWWQPEKSQCKMYEIIC